LSAIFLLRNPFRFPNQFAQVRTSGFSGSMLSSLTVQIFCRRLSAFWIATGSSPGIAPAALEETPAAEERLGLAPPDRRIEKTVATKFDGGASNLHGI
jgi:hypothetical protein